MKNGVLNGVREKVMRERNIDDGEKMIRGWKEKGRIFEKRRREMMNLGRTWIWEIEIGSRENLTRRRRVEVAIHSRVVKKRRRRENIHIWRFAWGTRSSTSRAIWNLRKQKWRWHFLCRRLLLVWNTSRELIRTYVDSRIAFTVTSGGWFWPQLHLRNGKVLS